MQSLASLKTAATLKSLQEQARQEPNPPPSDLLGLWRLLMSAARAKQRLGLEAQRRRLVRSIVANDMQRKGIS